MIESSETNLADEALLAIAHCDPGSRDALRIFLDLDARLARIVTGTSEAMLGQMRLAWWRETLAQPREERPRGDAVLDAIGEHWGGREDALVALVDGWEHLLAEPPLSAEDADSFAKGRQTALCAVFDAGEDPACGNVAWRWALADLAAKVSLEEERAMLVDLGLGKPAPSARVPPRAKPLAMLGALGLRALKRGGRPLMEGRGASLTAARAALFRR